MIKRNHQSQRFIIKESPTTYLSTIFLVWLLVFYWIGVIFYEFISIRIGLYYTDEILVAILILIYAVRLLTTLRLSKYLLYTTIFLFAYLAYSLYIGINTTNAILNDLAVVSKAPVTLIIIMAVRPAFSHPQWRLLKINAIAGAIVTLGIILMGEETARSVFYHPSRLATTAILSALLYFLSSVSTPNSKINRADLFIFFSIMTLSLTSERSKAYGFFVIALIYCTYFYVSRHQDKSPSLTRFTLLGIAAGLLGIYAAIDKLIFYFIQGTQGYEIFARPALYITSFEIAKDYFPFGSGLASFASYYSGVYYSPLYANYGIDQYFGLSRDNPTFISDTLLPMILGQFGFFGMCILVLITAKSYQLFKDACRTTPESNRFLLIGLLMITFCVIESFVDSTMVQNRGVFVLALLALTYISAKTESTRHRTSVSGVESAYRHHR